MDTSGGSSCSSDMENETNNLIGVSVAFFIILSLSFLLFPTWTDFKQTDQLLTTFVPHFKIPVGSKFVQHSDNLGQSGRCATISCMCTR